MASLSMRMCVVGTPKCIVEATLFCMCSGEKEYINNCCCHPICIDDMRNADDTRENEASLKGKGGNNSRHVICLNLNSGGGGGKNRKTFHSASIFPFIVNKNCRDNCQRSSLVISNLFFFGADFQQHNSSNHHPF